VSAPTARALRGAVFAVLAWNGMRVVSFVKEDATVLWFFDVGQGDATFIRDPDGRSVLIDAGPSDSVLKGLEKAMPFWEREIDVIIITHYDADHFLGLFAILGRYDIGEIWVSGAYPTTKEGRRLLEKIRASGIPMRSVAKGEGFEFREGKLSVIYPPFVLDGRPVIDKNNASITSEYDCGDETVLFMADIEKETETELLRGGKVAQVEILKVGHHGSANSSTSAFLDATRPKQAVISSGAGNRYGHPAPSVLMRLMERGIRIHRTDREGHIRFSCDGERLRAS